MKVSDLEGKVQTVLGAIDGAAVGPATCHEHLLWDMSVYFKDPASASERAAAHEPVSLDNLYWVRANPNKNVDNMLQMDEALAIKEALHFKRAGGGTIVELSQDGLSRNPLGLLRIAQATDLNIVMGSGYYIGESHPSTMDELTADDIADSLVREITEGVGDTQIRPGIIGEIGCSTPFTPNEEKVLRGCALAQQETGAAMNVHPSIGDEELLQNIRVLKEAGADLSHVAVSHIDGFGFSKATIRRVLDEGCYAEHDGFGQALYHFPYMDRMANTISDMQRICDIVELIKEGYVRQILIAQDLCFKCCLAAYGGYGYGHILTNLPPAMRYQGMTEEDIHTLLVDNPRRFLEFRRRG